MSELKNLLLPTNEQWKNLYVNNLNISGATSGITKIESPNTLAKVECKNTNTETKIQNNVGGSIILNDTFSGNLSIQSATISPSLVIQPSTMVLKSPDVSKILSIENSGIYVNNSYGVGVQMGGTQILSNSSVVNSYAGPFRTIFGKIDGTSGQLLSGCYGVQASTRNSVGEYSIGFTDNFQYLPTYQLTTRWGPTGQISVYILYESVSAFQVKIVDSATGNPIDTSFYFTVMGI